MVKPEEKLSEVEKQKQIWLDPRFSHLVSDPRFKNLPKSERKVKIDKRFESMFNDKKFKIKYTVDKYGRKVNKSSSEDLKKYYEIDSSEDEEEQAREKQEEEKQIVKDDEIKPGDNDVLESDGEVVPIMLKERLFDHNIDYARGEGRLISDSSSDEESSENEDDELYIEHVWGELDRDAETTEESSNRLAVCNMDWDRIRASDIMVVCSSFLPPGGSILSVTIYPSEFGKQRMAEEEIYGPPELTKKTNEDEDNSDSDDELVKEQDSDAEVGDDYHMEKLRQYQLNRLKYYYAVIVCDSVPTAEKIYQECDGIEYESSATKFDLRFIPDDTSFDEDEPKDICTSLPEAGQYQPRSFTTTALQQATVDLTWDETSLERKEVGDKLLSGKINEVSDADIKKFVAYSSEEEEEDEDENEEKDEEQNICKTNNPEEVGQVKEQTIKAKKENTKKKDDPISKYKALLQEITDKEEKAKKNKFEMEYSWNVAEEKSVETKEEKTTALTPIEKVLQKRSEKNKRRKEDRKKKKNQSSEGDIDNNAIIDSDDSNDYPDDIDMNDPYFAEEFANGDFEVSKATKKNKNKNKSKKRESTKNEEEDQKAKELALLMDDDDDEEKQHFSLEKIIKNENDTKSKKKRRQQLKKSKGEITQAKKDVEDNFEINVQDDRFKAIFTSHHFNIDPTNSHFKKTKGMEQIIHEKLKRRHETGDVKKNLVASEENEMQSKRPKKLIENSMLVKSLKRKLQQQQKIGRK